MANIGFIGLGNMGGPMASNLLKAGHSIRAFDLVDSALQAIAQEGGESCDSAIAAVDGVDTVISMLPASEHVENLYLGDKGLLTAISPGTLVIDSSTIAPASSRKISAAAAEKNIPMLDAPVSGGQAGAENGQLTIMCGGREEAFAKAEPVMQAFAKQITHIGEPGAGQTAKMVNQICIAGIVQGLSEGLAFAQNAGLDPAKVRPHYIHGRSG